MAIANQNSRGSQEKNTWICPNCETINSGDKCVLCGYPKPNGDQKKGKVCKCGHQNSMHAKFCEECGRKLVPIIKWKKILFASVFALSFCVLVSVLFKPHIHDWKAATCTSPKTCESCGETSGLALGHTWKAATCTTPKTCESCGETSGLIPGHTWIAATCTTPKTCVTCGETTGASLGHEWKDATYNAPKTCIACGKTIGEPEGGYISYIDGDWESITLHDGYSNLNTYAFAFSQELKQCKKMTVNMNVSMKAGTKCKEWQLWGRIGGKFKKIAKISLPNGNGSTSQTVEFDSPISLDAIVVTPTVPGGYSWSMGLSVTDVWFEG